MKCTKYPVRFLIAIVGFLILSGCSPKEVPSDKIQAGFYTPERPGQLWDTWVYYYKGTFYQFYLAGIPGKWDSFELMTSNDGVNWKEYGRLLEPRPGTTWMGTGHIIEDPGFKNAPRWIMNYSEWFGDRQDIMFAVSDDLFHWQKVADSNRFSQDERWYQPKGRWDCIDAVQREDGSFYGYFTADPIPGRSLKPVCGFGFAESSNGVNWTALPPVEGNITGEFGGIQKIGNRYYITISEGRIASADKPEGPFLAQVKNPNMFGKGFDMYFPRFFHNPPLDKTLDRNGVLVNHFYTGSDMIHSGPLKAVEIDKEGILRLKWWKQNDLLRQHKLGVFFEPDTGGASPIRFLRDQFDLSKVIIVEANIQLSPDDPVQKPTGYYFESNPDSGYVLLLNRREAAFGTMKNNRLDPGFTVRINRDINFDENSRVRLVFKKDMMEAYVDDYLMMLKRFKWSGRLGIIGQEPGPGKIRAWCHN